MNYKKIKNHCTSKTINKCVIIKDINGKCYLSYLLKINTSYAFGYKFTKNKWIPIKVNLDEITSVRPYRTPNCENGALGVTSLALLACF